MACARFLLPLLLAAILGAGAADANAARPSKRPVAAESNPDEAFVRARHAAMQGDASRFEAAAARAAGHPLADYLDYWRLRLRVAPTRGGESPQGSDGGADADVRAFIARHDGKLVADLLRRDWMLDLGRRGEWARLEQEDARWILRDDAQAACYAWLAAVQRGRALPGDARQALLRPRELGEGCGALLERVASDGTLTRAQLWLRLRHSLEIGATASVRRIATLLELPAPAVAEALQRPARALAAGAAGEIAVIAVAQIARQDPDAALARLDTLGALPGEERAFLTAHIAAHAMRRLSPQTLALARRSLQANASDETWVWLARAALRDGDWATLQAVHERMGPEARDDPAWIYWRARADRALGRAADADARLRTIAQRFDFYGQLAAEELGELVRPPVAAPAPSAAELAEPARNPGFARALGFYGLGLRFEGNREWNFQLRGMSDRQLLAAAHWACQREVLDRCVNTAERTLAEHDFSLRFITPFREHLSPVAEQRGLDPAWVYGLIRQESRFILDARSSASAQGLMQIIPPTARWIARRLGEPDFRLEHLNDMQTNLRFGTYYLRTVLDDLDGSALLASAGYNAGPNRPRRWRSTLPATVEGAVFAEIIPFPETRDYVKKVLSNATVYSAMMTGRPQSLKALLGTVEPAPASRSELP